MNNALSLFDHVGDGAFAIDDEQNIIFWSETAEQMLGYPAAEALGRKCWDLLRGETAAGVPYCCPECPIVQLIRQKIPVRHFDLVVHGRDNAKSLINVSTLIFSTEKEDLHASILLHLHRPLRRPETETQTSFDG